MVLYVETIVLLLLYSLCKHITLIQGLSHLMFQAPVSVYDCLNFLFYRVHLVLHPALKKPFLSQEQCCQEHLKPTSLSSGHLSRELFDCVLLLFQAVSVLIERGPGLFGHSLEFTGQDGVVLLKLQR